MKPKTKIQFEVVRLSKNLAPITEKQIAWAYDHCIDHIGRISKKGITCLDCFHTWNYKPILLAKLDGCHCPNCERKLKVNETRRRVFKDAAYFAITTTYKGFQLSRYFDVKAKFQSNKPAEYSCHEIAQRWISNKGKGVTLSVSRYSCFGCSSEWRWWEDMEIRHNCHQSSLIVPYKTYPAVRYLPEIKRNGFKGNYHGIKQFDFFCLILENNQAETLLKCGEVEWLKIASYDSKAITRCWPAIRIALRHKRNIKEKNFWLDYIDLLLYFKKDIRNPKVIFPADIRKEHDRLVKKKRKIQDAEALEVKKKKAIEQEEAYKKSKGKYFGIAFSDGLISIRVLSSVREIVEEGDALNHCVYTNNYHMKADSLLLSASLNGKRLETIEVDLKQLKVVQCRGAYNKNTEYHNQILELVNKNLNQIRTNGRKKKQKQNTYSQSA